MNEISELIDAAARAAVEHQGDTADTELAAVSLHGREARSFVWDRHYAGASERHRLHEKLRNSSPEFQAAVAAIGRVLEPELAADNERRAQVRAANPELFKD